MTDDVRFGFLATGKIARSVAADLALVPGASLAAVGARREESARDFAAWYAAEHGQAAPRAHGSYAELVADDDVDVVYVATPHSFHLDHVRLALEAGKHVLCEKPVTLDRADAEEMVALAQRHDRFLMEAMWTACHPVVIELRERLAAGDLGEPRHLHAELGFRVDADPSDRLLDPALGASALLDMGIYPLTLGQLLLGEPEELAAVATLSDGGIDLDVAISARYAGGALGSLHASMTSWSSRGGELATDRGRVVLEGQFHHPTAAVFTPWADGSTNDRSGTGEPLRLEGREPVIGRGYGNEVAEVVRCVREGLRESPLVPHAQTLAVMGQLDRVRELVGVRFPSR